MSVQDIYTRITPIFHDIFDDDDIVLSSELSAGDVEDWDSLTHIRLIVAVEKELSIKFSASEISNLLNVGDFVNLINEKLGS
jgi:acyl carrier protein